jgi:hypothetical protein
VYLDTCSFGTCTSHHACTNVASYSQSGELVSLAGLVHVVPHVKVRVHTPPQGRHKYPDDTTFRVDCNQQKKGYH